MRFLVTNDDGVESRGIAALAEALAEAGEVTVVAPLLEQSAAGHAITMHTPLRIFEKYRGDRNDWHAVNGTPADCVKLGVDNILREPPDAVVSGINHGANTATNVIYSGTVSAAREAAILGYPGVAVSIASRAAENLDVAAAIARDVVVETVKRGVPNGTLLNVNVPDLPADKIKGVKITRQGRSRWNDRYERRQDLEGRDYFWLGGRLEDGDEDADADQRAVREGYAAVTPALLDMTDYETIKALGSWNIPNLVT
jgi:5'-nucleotidase